MASTDVFKEALGKFYQSHVYKGMPISTAAEPIKKACEDPDVKALAASRLAELSALNARSAGRLSMRCFVSSIEKSGLEEALNGQR